MAIQNRSTVVSLKPEVTEGTLVFATGTGSFIPVQDDFSMTPSFDTLENNELKNSLGKGKPIQGLENPQASFSLYLKHSGTSGTAPGYGDLLQAAFGEEDDAGVEHNTVAGSTTSVINVDAGEGATYQKGQLLLIQDATNGYSIRPVYSISSDALTLAFNLTSAPASGVDLGEAVMYRPANSAHQTVSLVQYVGNGGAIQAMSGGRVTEVSIDFTAGELINTAYTVEGIKFFFNPIEITSSTEVLDFNIGGSELSASVTVKVYQDPHELAAAIETAMDALSADEITVTYSNSTGKFTIASGGATLNLLWNTGTNTASTIGTKIGFSVAADDTGATTYTSDNAYTLTAAYTPSYDNADPLVAKSNVVFIGDASDNVCFEPSTVNVTLSLEKADILSVCATSGKSGSVISGRSCTISVTALLSTYDVDKFRRLRENDDTRFFYAFGEKSGGNWVEGKCGGVYSPTCVVSSFELAEDNGLVVMNLELQTYVDSSGNPEIFLGFV
jgi:hypothetical protein